MTSVIYSKILKEFVHVRTKYSLGHSKKLIGDKVISVLGYGPQARGQSLNLRDNGFNVVLGLRQGDSYEKALKDGWETDKNLFSLDEASQKGDIIQYLLSDAGQIDYWPKLNNFLYPGNTLYFSHGFGIVYNDQTKIVPKDDIDVVMIAPKGPGKMVRDKFVEDSGINSSVAVYNDYSGKALDNAIALGFGIGSSSIFKTTFEKEVHSDLFGERSVLMGLIQSVFKAQYDILRENGHSKSEAYNETVEEALVSLYPLVNEKGMDWMFANCSTTAQRGALDWWKPYYDVIKPEMEKCYQSVVDGTETKKVISVNSDSNYRENLNKELDEIKSQELWQVAEEMRKYRI